MVQLTRKERAELRLEQSRKVGKSAPDPKYATIHQYQCGVCGVKKYYRAEDEDMPQYHTKRRMTKLGYGIGIAVCHDCFHEKGYTNPLVNHSSSCRICELNHTIKVAKRRRKAEAKLAAEAKNGKVESSEFSFSRTVSRVREQSRHGGGVHMSKRRRST